MRFRQLTTAALMAALIMAFFLQAPVLADDFDSAFDRLKEAIRAVAFMRQMDESKEFYKTLGSALGASMGASLGASLDGDPTSGDLEADKKKIGEILGKRAGEFLGEKAADFMAGKGGEIATEAAEFLKRHEGLPNQEQALLLAKFLLEKLGR